MISAAIALASALLGVAMAAAILCGAAVIASSGAVAGTLAQLQERINRRYGVSPEALGVPFGPVTASTVRLVGLLTGVSWMFAGLVGLHGIVTINQLIR